MGRPLSGDICGGKGGDIDRRRSVCKGTWGSGDGIGVVDADDDGDELIGNCFWC